jgi:hypothetical protein
VTDLVITVPFFSAVPGKLAAIIAIIFHVVTLTESYYQCG